MLEIALECALLKHRAESDALVVEGGSGRRVSHGELREQVAHLRTQLRALGLRPGCLVAFCVARTPEAVALTIAATIEGAVFHHSEPQYGLDALIDVVKRGRALALVVDDEGVEAFGDRAAQLGGLGAVYLPTLEPARGKTRVTPPDLPQLSVDPSVEAQGLGPRPAHPIAEGAASLCFTSGSTGQPKAIVLPGRCHLANAICDEVVYRMTPGDRVLHLLSIGHSYGISQMFSTLWVGAALHLFTELVATKREWRARVQQIVQQSGITGFHCGASLFATFVEAAPDEPLIGPGTQLRFISLAGAPLPRPQLARVLEALDPGIEVFKEYGQGEATRISTLLASARHPPERLDSVGRALPGVRIFITPDRETVAAPGQPGEVAIISPARVMTGYWGDEALTRRQLGAHPAFPDQTVLYTNDDGYLDSDGYLFLLGRRGSAFKRSWVLVYPEAVETQLLEHPEVAQAVVFGIDVKDAVQPGRTIAIVRTRGPVTREELRTWTRESLPPYHVPDDLQIWATLPQTASAKLDRREIRRRYLAEQCPWPVADSPTP